MINIEENLNNINDIQKIQIISLIKHSIKLLLYRANLKLRIDSIVVYKILLIQIIKIVSIQTKITNKNILKQFRNLVLRYTTKGLLYPITFEALIIDFVELLEYICISFPSLH